MSLQSERTDTPTPLLEVIGFNIESCHTAQENGAGRIELCDSPGEGGTTPSYGFIKEARKLLRIPLYVMIRPRGGDFLYSDREFRLMMEDIAVCKQLGCDGVVFGILHPDGSVDVRRNRLLAELAYPMGVTFHRAFDRVSDPVLALEDVINSGCERILTSGLRPKAEQGLELIADLVCRAEGRISIMPGSGVNADNIQKIIEAAGVKEVHSSASGKVNTQMKYENAGMQENLMHVGVDGEAVKSMVQALTKLSK